MDATTVAVDLAKDVFQVALANRAGRIIERQRLTRRQFERLLNGMAVDTEIIMESCGTAHYWGRRAQAGGLRVRLLPVQYVRPMFGAIRRIGPTARPYSKPLVVPKSTRCR
jgi:transposase